MVYTLYLIHYFYDFMAIVFPSSFNRLTQAAHPHHPLYHPIQLTLFTAISSLCVSRLTGIPPTHLSLFVASAYVISQLMTPLFVDWFQPYHHLPLAPLIGQALQITTSVVGAKITGHILRFPLSIKEIKQATLILLIAIFALQQISSFCQSNKRLPIDRQQRDCIRQ
ncbi:MAG: hypothetical protein ACH350_02155 [Parachlamydiaceae bacterium]